MTGKKGHRGWGTVQKLPSGNWRASYVGPDLARHNGPITYSAKGNAEAWLVKERKSIEEGRWEPPKSLAEEYRRQEAERRLIAAAKLFIDTLDAPTVEKASQYLYVFEIIDHAVKVGITTAPRNRLKTHLSEANAYGRNIGRIWLSQAHSDARTNEVKLMMLDANTTREYLTTPFDQVVQLAETLCNVRTRI
jgi:hypothetical protein